MALSLKSGKEEAVKPAATDYGDGISFLDFEKKDYTQNLKKGEYNGYLDSYRSLLNQLKNVREEYRIQLEAIPKKEKDIKDNIKHDIGAIIFCILSVFVMAGIIYLTQELRIKGAMAFVSVMLSLFAPAAELVLLVFVMPQYLRSLFRYLYHLNLMTSDVYTDAELNKRGIISFNMERRFLKRTINEIDEFIECHNEQGERIGIEEGKNVMEEEYTDVGAVTEWSMQQAEDITVLRRLTTFKDYKSSPVKKDSALKQGWVMLITITVIAIAAILLIVLTK